MFFFISVPNFLVVTSGYDDSGRLSQTETLSFGNNSDSPIYPDHPRRIDGATGGFLHHDFITCGGNVLDEGFTNKCFKLGSEEPFATMMTKRVYFASVVLEPGKLWILGGSDGSILSSTEFIFSDGRNEEGPSMPIALWRHAIVKINGTTSLLVGGYTGSAYSQKSWYYEGNWNYGPNLKKARSIKSGGIIRDQVTNQIYIVVAGGGSNYLNDVEILSVTGTAWETGNLL